MITKDLHQKKKNGEVFEQFKTSFFFFKDKRAKRTSSLLILIYNTCVSSRGQNRKFSMDCSLFTIYK